MSSKKKLFRFGYEFIDLIIFLLLWASLWNVYDYLINTFVTKDKLKLFANLIIFIVGTILLFCKHMLIKSPFIII